MFPGRFVVEGVRFKRGRSVGGRGAGPGFMKRPGPYILRSHLESAKTGRVRNENHNSHPPSLILSVSDKACSILNEQIVNARGSIE